MTYSYPYPPGNFIPDFGVPAKLIVVPSRLLTLTQRQLARALHLTNAMLARASQFYAEQNAEIAEIRLVPHDSQSRWGYGWSRWNLSSRGDRSGRVAPPNWSDHLTGG
jgi:hypothetical protein